MHKIAQQLIKIAREYRASEQDARFTNRKASPFRNNNIPMIESNTENETHTFTGGWRNSYSLCFKGRNNRKTSDKM